jgi:Protein of unknown function (DUF2997)
LGDNTLPIRVEVIISEDGEAQVEVFGAHGAECEKITDDLEKSFGKTTKRSRKSEYYQQTQSRDQETRM